MAKVPPNQRSEPSVVCFPTRRRRQFFAGPRAELRAELQNHLENCRLFNLLQFTQFAHSCRFFRTVRKAFSSHGNLPRAHSDSESIHNLHFSFYICRIIGGFPINIKYVRTQFSKKSLCLTLTSQTIMSTLIPTTVQIHHFLLKINLNFLFLHRCLFVESCTDNVNKST